MPRKRETLSEYIEQCSESNPVPRESLNDERRCDFCGEKDYLRRPIGYKP